MNFEISTGPHIRAKDDAKSIMWWVAFALLFPSATAVYFFGISALILIIFTTLIAVISEVFFQFVSKRPITVPDGSAVVTGLLLALILPSGLPLWIAAIGSFFAIVIAKGLFGGLGFNIFNPALAARAFLVASWPVAMTMWLKPFSTVTSATPLYLSKIGEAVPGYLDLFLGNRGGCLGETSVLAILIGAGILFYKKIIDWPAPAAYIGTVFILSFLLGKDPVFHIMAADYVTVPVTTKGRFIFGLGCGIMTVLIRFYGGFPEGVNYSILLMNILTPVIDKYARPRLFGALTRSRVI